MDDIHQNRTFELFNQLNYFIVTSTTGFFPTDIQNSDLYIEPENYINSFEEEYLFSTIFKLAPELLYAERTRAIIQTPLQALPDLAKNHPNDAKFFFIHIPAAHVPFVFDKEGGNTPMWTYDTSGPGTKSYKEAYAEQVIYINGLVLEAIDGILKNSFVRPIIIIQSDHGPQSRAVFNSVENTCLRERMSILNAYYLPETAQQKLYPSITPVNTFRLILDEVYGTKFGLIEDRVYFSLWFDSSNFVDVTDRADSCAGWGE